MNTMEMKEIFIHWLNPREKINVQVQKCWKTGEIDLTKCKILKWEDLVDMDPQYEIVKCEENSENVNWEKKKYNAQKSKK